ncbi:serpin family protein [Flavobacterium sp. UBA6031]|uniref:serpin family protein n=1 Tax=Flavobacterium sp. UBA6031 TaxID=1946551 RepID=UPI0025B879BC|nr:serpin family protein [Flavobacterium sp. UBA6031]
MKRLLLLFSIFPVLICCTTQNEPIPVPEDAKPIALRIGLEKRVAQDNEFAFDLLKKTITSSGGTNVFISPLSVSIALGMVWNGANGQTKTEMETVLKMSGMSVTDINDYYQIMQSTLPTIDPTTKLNIANSLWYKTGFPVKPDFLKINTDYFNAYVKDLDFSKAWAVDTINNWCAKKTNNLIKDPLDQISPDAVMYLVNAIYFKGIWRKHFEAKNTKEMDFTGESGNLTKVNMMYQKDTFAYTVDTCAQYLDMPYGNKAFSMTVILPDDGKTTNDILNYLTPDIWDMRLQNMSSKEVEVYMPRFKNKNKFLLNDPLKSLGMNLAFSDDADFTNIADARLKISRVLHDTYIEVTEEGTEAAAVTIVEVMTTSMPIILPTPVFKVNKPFLFVIREKSTGVILFIGKMGSVDKF